MSQQSYTQTRQEQTIRASYGGFTRALESLMGTMNMAYTRDLGTKSPEEARRLLASFVGPSDFSLFQKIDHGALLTALEGRKASAITYVFGNALIAIEMTKYEPRVGLYVPLRLYVKEVDPEHVLVTYDLPSSQVAQFGSPEAAAIAKVLDGKVHALIESAIAKS